MYESKAKRRAWELSALERGLIPQPHGGALMPGGGFRPGAGRPKSRVKLVLDQAKGDPVRQLRLAAQLMHDQSLPIDDVIRAATFIWKLAIRLDRNGHRRTKPAAFRVVRVTAEEALGCP
jgi:hypothetical protein